MAQGVHGWCAAALTAIVVTSASAQQVGSIRGTVVDEDLEAPLAGAQVTISETGARAIASDGGNFVFSEVPPGTYTLVFTKEGYDRQLKTNVVVAAGQLTEVDAALPGELTDMDEVVAQDLQMRAGSEASLLKLRFENIALLDSIGADLIKRSGASDAAAALRLVSGATTQQGKFAVIRGLPDRYVSSQLNGVRLPSADADTRAVDLELFPAPAIQSIQVSKTFTPDQQGDASGGAVNVVLKSLPEESIFQVSGQVGYNSQVGNRDDFLTYKGGGIPDYWGKGDGGRVVQPLGQSWTGAVGVDEGEAPPIYKWSVNLGGTHDFDDGVKIGGFTSLFYERDADYYNNGQDNGLWVTNPGQGLVPQTKQGTPQNGDFKTSLYDITQGSQFVRWGWLGTAGIELQEKQAVNITYLYTRLAEDVATLAQDTRGKSYFFPGYDLNNLDDPGNAPLNRFAAPWLRTETLDYTERTTQSLIFNGRHVLPTGEFGVDEVAAFGEPELDWTIASSSATFDQPDKRTFGSLYLPPSLSPGFPPFLPPFPIEQEQTQYKPDANFTLGNLQRTFQSIDEQSTQGFVNLKLPFEQWTDSKGYFKFGGFYDNVNRDFQQQSFSNFNDNSASFPAPYTDFWSAIFPWENHPITAGPPFVDANYTGNQRITAGYGMLDLPLTSYLNVVGGARYETTDISTTVFPEPDATWFPIGAISPVKLNPGDADVSLSQANWLPSIGLILTPIEKLKIRAWYAETIARPVFKELTPILQQEYLGGDTFIGNPDLVISTLQNYDFRVDYEPYEGALLSGSYFYKSIANPIQNVQRYVGFTFTTPVNYPKGSISGVELELRQDLGVFWEGLKGLNIGGNATFLDSSVTLPADEIALFGSAAIQVPMSTQNLTGAPRYLYNLFFTYESPYTGTNLGLFYTVKGDTLLAGATVFDGNFVPSVYSTEFGTLNFTISQKLGDHFSIFFQAKNLTNPDYTEVYRSSSIGGDVLKSSYSLGIDLAVGLSATFTF